MTWVRDSDDVYDDEALREAGKDAAFLWSIAMRACARKEADGILSPLMVKDAASLYDIRPGPATTALVHAGKWHDTAGLAACGECLEHTEQLPTDRHRLIHRWWDHLLRSDGKEDPIKRKRERRRKALNSPRCLPIRQAVRERDRDLCRYCGVITIWETADRKSATRGTFDHVDPWGDNTVDNLVVACKRCNGRKNERTPEEAGMRLLDPGTTRDQARSGRGPDPAGSAPEGSDHDPAAGPVEPGTAPDASADDPAADPTHARHARETGAGQVGPGRNGPGSGPGPDHEPDREPGPALGAPS